MRIIKLKCESDQPCFDQRVHEVAVQREDEANWYCQADVKSELPASTVAQVRLERS